MVFLAVIPVFSMGASLLMEYPLKKKPFSLLRFLLNALLCAFLLLIASALFVSAIPVENLLDLENVTLNYTPRELSLLFLWLLLCAVGCLLFVAGSKKGNLSFLSRKQRSRVRVCILSLFLGFICCFSIKLYTESRLIINEVCAENESIIYDDNLKARDYVELYNPTVFPVSLADLYLTDDLLSQPRSLADVGVIPPKGYCLVWTDKAENGFGIQPQGEALFLMDGQKTVIDSVVVPALGSGQVYARDVDTQQWQLRYPTPLAENDPQVQPVDAPAFSAESGFYDVDFSLTLEAPEGCTIYYTLDSSIPDEKDSLYTQPITVTNVSQLPDVYRAVQNVTPNWAESDPTDPEGTVDKAFIVRAVAIDEHGNRSDVVTRTYFVGMPQYENKVVLSLVTDPENLFGDDGIYVTGQEYDRWYLGSQLEEAPQPNFEKRGKAYEAETWTELFQRDLLMAQNTGLRIQGGSSRSRSLKRFILTSRKVYSGSKYFSYDIFGSQVHSFHIRRDFEDAFCHALLTGSEIGGLQAIPVEVFLDGEYWYTAYLRERYADDDLALRFQVNSDSIQTSDLMPEEVLYFVEDHDLEEDAAYQALNQILDLENYAKYLSANIYLCNMDMSDIKNLRLWRTTGNGEGFDDGRWRFLLYDVDALAWQEEAFYGVPMYGVDSFTASMRYETYSHSNAPLFSALKRNETFRALFANTFMDLANTCFEKEHVASLLEQWGENRSWNQGFFDKRFDCIVPAMAQDLGLEGTLETITLASDPLAGTVTINSVTPSLTNGTWKGQYYTDFPVTISAQPKEGYKFVAWHQGDTVHTESTLSVFLDQGDNHFTAQFAPIGD